MIAPDAVALSLRMPTKRRLSARMMAHDFAPALIDRFPDSVIVLAFGVPARRRSVASY